jgi:hypothetical protein
MRNAACGFVFMMVLMASAIANAQLQYVTNADGVSVTVTNYLGDVPSQVVIPDTFDGLAVTGIGDNAFVGYSELLSVIIPNSVTNLGISVFAASGLTNMVFPSSITSIPDDTFGDCGYLANVFIPDSVVSIGLEAFFGSGLNNLTIPGSVTNIGQQAVAACDLTNLIISYGVPYISLGMFGGCGNMVSATITGSVTNIEDSAFKGCGLLSNVFFTGNAPAVLPTSFEQVIVNPFGSDTDYIAATAYYLPGTTGWAEFSSNTTMTPSEFNVTSNIFVPAVLWDPAIHAKGTNFGVQNGQYGFDITGTTNLPIAVEACDDLSQSNWVVLKRLSLTNGLFHFSEPLQTNSSSRFYRIGFP